MLTITVIAALFALLTVADLLPGFVAPDTTGLVAPV
jgi:hypothetical protein